MKNFYTSLDEIPADFLGNNKKKTIIENIEYQNLFSNIKNEIFKNLLDDEISYDLKIQVFAICNYIVLDLYKVFKSIIEIQACKKKKTKIFNKQYTTPIFDSILKNTKLKFPKKITKKNYVFESSRFLKNKLDLFLRGNRKYDLHNDSVLLQEYINRENINYISLRPECWINNNDYSDVDSEIMYERIKVIINNLSIRYDVDKDKIDSIIEKCTFLFFERFQKVNNIFKTFQKIDFERLTGMYLLGGTPQPLGRLLNHFYRINKKKVIRFSHGGDRVFFDDILWIYNELLFCDKYFVHGEEERINLESKIKQNLHKKQLFQIEVISKGSEKHKKIFEFFRKKNKNKNKRILFVPGCFLGEAFMHNPYFKPIDIVIADYISWTINIIKELGYDVTIKVHPGGLQFRNFFNNLSCEKIYGGFNIEAYDHSVFIFDFAGTAFFDSLASNKGIVYLNNLVRPFFNSNYTKLLRRCQIVDAYFDENNNIRFPIKDLKISLNSALDQQFCTDEFAKKLFFDSNS